MKAKIFTFGPRVSFSIVVCLLASSLLAVARAERNLQLSGHWTFNPSQSDRADQKIQQAKRKALAAQSAPFFTGEMHGSGSSHAGDGLGPNGDTWGAPGAPNFNDKDWLRLAENPKFLQIDQYSDHIVVATDSGQAQTYYLDGQKHEEKNPYGKKVAIKAGWQGDSFVTETKLTHSKKITQTFSLENNGGRLIVTTQFEEVWLTEPLVIRRVYDLDKSPAK